MPQHDVEESASIRTLNWRVLWPTLLGATVFLVALCTIPYHVPSKPVYSDSYVFGYNNHAGELIVACAAALLFFFGPKLPLRFVAQKPLTPSTLKKALGLSALISGTMYLCTRTLDGVGESIYLIDRSRLLLEGQVPYKQFEYIYGPAFLYAPVWLTRLFHLPLGDSYGLLWVALTVLGTWLLYKTIQGTDVPVSSQRQTFLFFWLISTAALGSFGINYSIFRFILPCYFSLVLYRRWAVEPKPQFGAILLALPMFAVTVLVSPEFGIAFALGVAFYLVLFGHLKIGANLLAFALFLSGAALILALEAHAGVFLTFFAFSAGAFNFPLMPAPHLLLFFLVLALCTCYAAQQLRARQPSALLLLIAVSTCAVPAALGRCDVIHVNMDALGIMIAGYFLLSAIRPLRLWVLPVLWFIYLLLPAVSSVKGTATLIAKGALPTIFSMEKPGSSTRLDSLILKQMTRSLGSETAAEKMKNIKAYAQVQGPIDVPATFDQPPGTVFVAPFGFSPSRFGIYHSPSVFEGFYLENQDVVTTQAVATKIAELAAHPANPMLLLPGREDACTVTAEASRTMIRGLFYYPYNAKPVHETGIAQPLCDYIQRHYHLAEPATPQHFGYALWLPNPTAPLSSQ